MKKTGELIAQTRREKGLTQKELGNQLHLSDRTVSKWERGAGFPDVSMLEPLAKALGVNVLDLLRGEPTQEADVDAALRDALEAFRQQRRRERRGLLVECCKVLPLLLLIVCFWLAASPPTTQINHTVTAGVYRAGELVAYTPVEIQGEVSRNVFNGRRSYWGRFAIGCVEWTCREGLTTEFHLNGEWGKGLTYMYHGTLTSDLHDIFTLCSYDMKEFALSLSPEEDGSLVLATSPRMYEEYSAQISTSPALVVPDSGWEPEFPVPWSVHE